MANLKSVDFIKTGLEVELPKGNTAERPSNPKENSFRYNTDYGMFEFFDGEYWTPESYEKIIADSAEQIIRDYPKAPNGNYKIRSATDGFKKVYCWMNTNDGGGWMLYSSFSTTNPLRAPYYKAWAGNNITLGSFSTYGYDLDYYSHYHDGATNSLGGYTWRQDYFAHYYSSGPNGRLDMDTWQGPDYVTKLMVKYGGGATTYWSNSNLNYTNGVFRFQGQPSPIAFNINVMPFDPFGATPLFRQVESGIAGLSWIFMK